MIHMRLVLKNYTTEKLLIIRSEILPGKLRSEKVCSTLGFSLKSGKLIVNALDSEIADGTDVKVR